MILAGDIGGTNSRFAVFEAEGDAPRLRWEKTVASAGHPSFLGVLEDVMPEAPPVDAASFGIAGPVRDGVCVATNLPWRVAAADVARVLDMGTVGLINDLEATAWGIDALSPDSLHVLLPGRADARGNRALVAAGTGLGEAGAWFDGRSHQPFACEGGHASFSPTSETEVALWQQLHAKHGHVSWERVLSGRGLEAIYDFFLERAGGSDTPAIAAARLAGSFASAVTEAAGADASPAAEAALDLFATLYGAEAGNLALKLFAVGGVFLGGGIAPRILPWLTRRGFSEAFLAKGRLREVLEHVPVSVILDPRVALRGAARHAVHVQDQTA